MKLKSIFWSFQLFANVYIHEGISTLINVVKLDVENSNAVSTLSSVAKANVVKYNVGLTKFNVVNFSVDTYNVVSTLI